MALCTEQGFGYYFAWADHLRGWSLRDRAQGKEGIGADAPRTGGLGPQARN